MPNWGIRCEHEGTDDPHRGLVGLSGHKVVRLSHVGGVRNLRNREKQKRRRKKLGFAFAACCKERKFRIDYDSPLNRLGLRS